MNLFGSAVLMEKGSTHTHTPLHDFNTKKNCLLLLNSEYYKQFPHLHVHFDKNKYVDEFYSWYLFLYFYEENKETFIHTNWDFPHIWLNNMSLIYPSIGLHYCRVTHTTASMAVFNYSNQANLKVFWLILMYEHCKKLKNNIAHVDISRKTVYIFVKQGWIKGLKSSINSIVAIQYMFRV